MMAHVSGFAAARLVLLFLCIARFTLLFINDGLVAGVYDRQTLLFIRKSMNVHGAQMPCHGVPLS